MNTPFVIQAADRTASSILLEIDNLRGSLANESPDLAVRIEGVAKLDALGAGFHGIASLDIQGELGDFGLCSLHDCECRVDGNVGDYFCHSLKSGLVILKGHAKNSLCALGWGGFLAIYGNAGDRLAVGLQGAEMVIRGSAGDLACLGMQDGCVVIGGNTGRELGQGMRGGTIYLRGDAQSISPDIEEIRVREQDRLKIGLLMIKAGIKSAGKEFRMYRSVHSESN